MGVPVRELQERMDSDEFTYWLAYNKIDPIGGVRGDYHAALIASTVAKANSSKGRRIRMEDFVFQFGGRRKLKDPVAIFNALKALHGNNRHT